MPWAATFLSASAVVAPGALPPAPVEASPPAPPSQAPSDLTWHLRLSTRVAAQLSWDPLPGGPKDDLESPTTLVVGASWKPSEGARYEAGIRVQFSARWSGTRAGLELPVSTFEARPWETYVDAALLAQVRVRLGYQIVSWGRLDVGSAADMLGAYDYRQGPATDVDLLRIPTPTMTLSWYPGDAFQLDIGYTPFFTPDQIDVFGTNYALIGPNVAMPDPASLARVRAQLGDAQFTEVTDRITVLNGPDARPDRGEVAARATWRAGPFDAAATAGYLRSKLPLISVDSALAALLTSSSDVSLPAVTAAYQSDRPLIVADYDRYWQLAFDVEAPVGPLTVAAEAGYTPGRRLEALTVGEVIPGPQPTGLSQIGGKITYAPDETTVVSAEASLFQATDTPARGSTYLLFGRKNRLGVGTAVLHKAFGRLVFDATLLATTSGDSASLVVREGYQASPALEIGIGGAFFQGSRADPMSLGALQKGLDQGFVFLSWAQ